jgi:hypothetical protein
MQITRHCRQLTHESGQTVYLVEDAKGKQTGLRVPQHIYQQVLDLNAATKGAREAAVLKSDLALETKVKGELLKIFPKLPEEEVGPLLKHMLKKRSGRVGRSTDIDLNEMVVLGVRAHVRHTHTDYDALLKGGMSRDKARETIKPAVDRIVKVWSGEKGRWKPLRTAPVERKRTTRDQKSSSKRRSGKLPRTLPAPRASRRRFERGDINDHSSDGDFPYDSMVDSTDEEIADFTDQTAEDNDSADEAIGDSTNEGSLDFDDEDDDESEASLDGYEPPRFSRVRRTGQTNLNISSTVGPSTTISAGLGADNATDPQPLAKRLRAASKKLLKQRAPVKLRSGSVLATSVVNRPCLSAQQPLTKTERRKERKRARKLRRMALAMRPRV